MLSIKKRFPRQKAVLYGGTAFVAGFAGIMAVLVQTDTNLDRFIASSPIVTQERPVAPAEQTGSGTTTSSQSANQTSPAGTSLLTTGPVNPGASTRSSGTSGSTGSSSSPSSTPSGPSTGSTQPAPSEPAPQEPAPSEPTPEPQPEPQPEPEPVPEPEPIIDLPVVDVSLGGLDLL
jgi:hypothetical protein